MESRYGTGWKREWSGRRESNPHLKLGSPYSTIELHPLRGRTSKLYTTLAAPLSLGHCGLSDLLTRENPFQTDLVLDMG